jgi:hypothetical protein
MDKAKPIRAGNDYKVKRLTGEDFTDKINKSDALSGEMKAKIATGKDMSGAPHKVSASWRVTAISKTPDEILEKVFRERRDKKDIT